jgi:hypothetical protein
MPARHPALLQTRPVGLSGELLIFSGKQLRRTFVFEKLWRNNNNWQGQQAIRQYLDEPDAPPNGLARSNEPDGDIFQFNW